MIRRNNERKGRTQRSSRRSRKRQMKVVRTISRKKKEEGRNEDISCWQVIKEVLKEGGRQEKEEYILIRENTRTRNTRRKIK